MKYFMCLVVAMFPLCAVAQDANDFPTALQQCRDNADAQHLMGSDRTASVDQCIGHWRENHPSRFQLPTAEAAPPTKQAKNPIAVMIFAGDQGAMAIMLGSLQTDVTGYQKANTDLNGAISQLDTSVTAAVKMAKGQPDLVKAIKDYYTAASAYLANGIATNGLQKVSSDRLKVDMDAKEKALQLEEKLAGSH